MEHEVHGMWADLIRTLFFNFYRNSYKTSSYFIFMPNLCCTQCGNLLLPRVTPYGKWMACPAGHTQPQLNQEHNILVSKNKEQGRKIEVGDGLNILAVHDHTCKRCGYGQAELIEMLASYSDEDNIYRMKCGQCGFVEQLEGKVK